MAVDHVSEPKDTLNLIFFQDSARDIVRAENISET